MSPPVPPVAFANHILTPKYQTIRLVSTGITVRTRYGHGTDLVLQEQQHGVGSRAEHRGELRGQLAARHDVTRRRGGQGGEAAHEDGEK